jgi:carbonic anhydrase
MALLDPQATKTEKVDLLCELNVVEQVANLARTTIVQDAWRRGHAVTLHGLIYGLADGRLTDLGIDIASPADAAERYPLAIEAKRGWMR